MPTAFGPDAGNKLIFHVFQDERFVDLNLYQYGWERTEPLHSYGPHRRNPICSIISSPGRAGCMWASMCIRWGRGRGF